MKNKGFTLIELMVVIAIIGLLSSIVLVSLKDARDKGKGAAFRGNVDQFVKALELYKSSNGGLYPGQQATDADFGFYTGPGGPGITNVVPVPGFVSFANYQTAMTPFMKSLPVPYNLLADYFIYAHGATSGLFTGLYQRCNGETRNSAYVILVSSNALGFSDWPYAYNTDTSLIVTSYRCFSLK